MPSTNVLRAILSITLLIVFPALTRSQVNQSVMLEVGKGLDREIKGDSSHNYLVTIKAGQFLTLSVDQRGIDIEIKLFNPEGKQISQVDSPNGKKGKELLLVIADMTGEYRVEVRSPDPNAGPGRYEIKLVELREATPLDNNRIAAQEAYTAGELLNAQGTREARMKAVEKFAESLPHWRAIGNRNMEANTMAKLGLVYLFLNEDKRALNYFNQALPLQREVGDRVGEANTLTNIGLLYYESGDNQKALEIYQQALPMLQEARDFRGAATTLNNIAKVYSFLGDNDKAIDSYNKAIYLSQAANDRIVETGLYSNLSSLYRGIGETDKAIESLIKSLEIIRSLGNKRGEAAALYRLGSYYTLIGDSQRAVEAFQDAVELMRQAGDRNGEANALEAIGTIYGGLGDFRQAINYYEQALIIARNATLRYLEADILDNIGFAYFNLKEVQKALESCNQALEIFRSEGDRKGELGLLISIGRIYLLNQEQQKAIELFNQVLEKSRAIDSRYAEALALLGIGAYHRQTANNDQAIEAFNQSLAIARAFAAHRTEAFVLLEMARAERNRGKLLDARVRIEEALAIIESLRVKSDNVQLRTSYFALPREYYEFYIELLMELHQESPGTGLDGEALQARERAIARSLVDMLTDARVEIRKGVDSELVERERRLLQLINDKSEILTMLLNNRLGDDKRARAQKELDKLTADLLKIQSEIRRQSPRYAAITQPQPVTLKEIQQNLPDNDTMLLEYALGKERSYLWAVTKNALTSYELPARADIESAALKVFNTISARTSKGRQNDAEFQKAAARLSELLLGPVAPLLGNRKLIIVSDGAIDFVPFSALPLPTGAVNKGKGITLVVRHEITNLPSASLLSALRQDLAVRQPARRALALFADPVYSSSDERVSATGGRATATKPLLAQELALKLSLEAGIADSDQQIKRLSAARREASRVASLLPPDTVQTLFDFQASKSSLFEAEMSNYRVIHLATHGLLNNLKPEYSGLILSMINEIGLGQDGFLFMPEIFNLNLASDLVVLSSFRTAGARLRSESLKGITRAFMYAGSPRVLISLWSVDEAASTELLSIFYKKMLVEKLSPTSALRAAQTAIAKDARWQSPHYWAGFQIYGDTGTTDLVASVEKIDKPAPVTTTKPEPVKPPVVKEPEAKPVERQIEKKEPPAVKPPEPAIVDTGGKFTVQIGASPSETEAKALSARLQAAGYASRVERADLGKMGIFYRVRTGRYKTAAEAKKLMAELKAKGFDGYVATSE